MTTKENFGLALRAVRRLRKVPQEALDQVSSRTYVSSLERGLKSPTLDKVNSIAEALDIHPLTLVAYTYLRQSSIADQQALLRRVQTELAELAANDANR
ncbi:helix-turn-helix domain-containing protein [Cupriavidus sp. RAF12]|uniref:helix-turn-helix domain-containing protein n=1 Tax=Cupriavidus sp. RAF12 TaxID=3233050 RepID=UPI003F92E7AF